MSFLLAVSSTRYTYVRTEAYIYSLYFLERKNKFMFETFHKYQLLQMRNRGKSQKLLFKCILNFNCPVVKTVPKVI
jgi:hypothetical protein